VRQKKILARPEEKVRVDLLKKMVHELAFPLHFLAVEKKVEELAVNGSSPPSDLRVDIAVSVTSQQRTFPTPLLLIECKAVPLDEGSFRQVVGYNYFIRAPFIAVANADELMLGWRDPSGELMSIPYLPSYEELITVISPNIS